MAADDGLDLTAFTGGDVELHRRVAQLPVRRSMTGRLAALEDDFRLSREIGRAGGDVYFSPDYSPPRRCTIPWVQTICDVTPMLIDDPLVRARRGAGWLASTPFSCGGRLIAISHFSADQAVAKLGLATESV